MCVRFMSWKMHFCLSTTYIYIYTHKLKILKFIQCFLCDTVGIYIYILHLYTTGHIRNWLIQYDTIWCKIDIYIYIYACVHCIHVYKYADHMYEKNASVIAFHCPSEPSQLERTCQSHSRLSSVWPRKFFHVFSRPKSVEISCLADSGALGLQRPKPTGDNQWGMHDQNLYKSENSTCSHINLQAEQPACLHSLGCLYPLFAVCGVIKSVLHGSPDLRLQVLSWEGLRHANLTVTSIESKNTF